MGASFRIGLRNFINGICRVTSEKLCTNMNLFPNNYNLYAQFLTTLSYGLKKYA
jgi:hypothetical protein